MDIGRQDSNVRLSMTKIYGPGSVVDEAEAEAYPSLDEIRHERHQERSGNEDAWDSFISMDWIQGVTGQLTIRSTSSWCDNILDATDDAAAVL